MQLKCDCVRIEHSTRKAKIAANILNTEYGSMDFFGPGPLYANNFLIQVRGTASGGTVVVQVQDLVAAVETQPGQTADQVVDALVLALDQITPRDDPTYTYGAQNTEAFSAAPPT